jgi:hypothetical protein
MLLFCGSLAPWSAHGATLERGLAITDPLALKELDGRALAGFGLNRMLDPAASDKAALLNDRLFALPSMAPVRKALDDEFERYVVRQKAASPRETIGVGPSFDFQLFDRAALYSSQTRFVLAGIVNRMDRGYVAPETCGEIRLIYRLTRTSSPSPLAGEGRGGGSTGTASVVATPSPDPSPQGGGELAPADATSSPRLPMTLNIVLKAKVDGATISCTEIARRWLAIADLPLSGVDLANRLMSEGGPLELIRPENIDRVETNLQIAHAPKSEVRDFRTDYLLKVFNANPQTRRYEEAPMENQLNSARLLSDAALGREFKAWLLDPKHLSELDRGTILVPDKFLASGAVAPTPVGFARSNLQPAFGLVEGEGATAPLFKQSDVVTALKQAAERGVGFENIRSAAGFERRLNDMTCAGCHQTRGIGGFHFPGVDWMAAKLSNSTVVPGSPHFFGDQVRRRDIVTALSRGVPQPDFSRGFSDRPQLRGTRELAGTEYDNGWGAHCYQQRANAADNDRSFRGWNCAAGLACQVMGDAGKSSRMGMCFVKNR